MNNSPHGKLHRIGILSAFICAVCSAAAFGAPKTPPTTAPAPGAEQSGATLGANSDAGGDGPIVIKDLQESLPIVLNQARDYLLEDVHINGLIDQAALTLTGSIRSVVIRHSRFGDIIAGSLGRAVAMESNGASVGSLTVSDSVFYDAENQLVALKEGSFGTVTFERCCFKNSDAFLKRLYALTPWRTTPPTTEFYNIDRLELLDNDFENTTIIIHPSVKTVVFRGDISHLQVTSPETRVMRLAPNENPWDMAALPPAASPDTLAASLPAAKNMTATASSSNFCNLLLVSMLKSE